MHPKHPNTLSNTAIMKKLKEVGELNDRILASGIHEIKQPLSGMLEIIQTLIKREQGNMNNQNIQDLNLLDSLVRRMSWMLNDLLEFKKSYTPQLNMDPQSDSLNVVTETVVDMLRVMVNENNFKINNRIPANFPKVVADKKRLSLILFHLLHITISLSKSGVVNVTAVAEGMWARISVSNNRAIIDESLLCRALDSNQQDPFPNVPLEDGLRVVISMCKELVKLHDGSIEVKSGDNEGITFTFSLKICATDEKSPFTDEEIMLHGVNADHSTQKMCSSTLSRPCTHDITRVLIVENDLVDLKVLQELFSSDDYLIHAVCSGEEALTSIDQDVWDLVIADVTLSEMSGYELTSKIREKFTMYELPVLLLTSNRQEECIEAGFNAGANDYLVKPLNITQLYSRTRSLVYLRRTNQATLRLEGAWLQAQIKPHFIINCFLAIVALSRVDLERMDALIDQLTKYIRLSIDFKNTDLLMPIKRELELVESYLAIQKERFGDRIQITMDVEYYETLHIPPLTIQSLVENAVSHGILKRTSGGEIRISIRELEHKIMIQISDNGIGMNEAKIKALLNKKRTDEMGIGIVNTDKRLKQLYGTGLEYTSNVGSGTTVSFTIPKHLAEDYSRTCANC